ncbi:MAG: M20/M25/M40 family metallo-hydrolase [Leptospiraceae bacterium]|nr:M20/M25/M40 family metallo-hydrolase [Leptospiraceae bacterium]
MKKIFISIGILFLLFILYIAFDRNSPFLPKTEFPKNLEKFEPNEEELTQTLKELLQAPTVRKEEILAAKVIMKVLDKEGIPYRLISRKDAPSRVNLIAELKGESSQGGIILLNHLDVVEVNEKEWDMPPFSGMEKEGYIYGRGAVDMKGMAIMELYAFIQVKRSKLPLKRNLMYLAVSDEETGSDYGAKYLAKEHKEIFEGYEYVINEGGIGTENVAFEGTKAFNLQFAEKGVVWVKVISKGKSGHGSSPPTSYATKQLMEYLLEIQQKEAGFILSEETKKFFASLGQKAKFPLSIILPRLSNPIIQKIAAGQVQENRHLRAMTSNTISVTGLKTEETGGYNVITDTAIATLDCRILPGETTEKFLNRLKSYIGNREISLEVFHKTEPTSSSIDSEFYNAISASALHHVSDAIITPFLSPGATDSSFMRGIGLKAYGLIPGLFLSEDIDGMHGKNERISKKNLILGTKILFDAIRLMN